jgi:hypothetical protein
MAAKPPAPPDPDRRRYRKLDVCMWGDGGFMQLSRPIAPNGQFLWVHLLSNPDTISIPGIYRTGLGTLADALRWPLGAPVSEAFREGLREAFAEGIPIRPPETLHEAFAELEEHGWVELDPVARLLWIPKAIAHNKPESPNVVTSWGRLWKELPECALKLKAWHSLKNDLASVGPTFEAAFVNRCPKPSWKPSAKALAKASPKGGGGALGEGWGEGSPESGTGTGTTSETTPLTPRSGGMVDRDRAATVLPLRAAAKPEPGAASAGRTAVALALVPEGGAEAKPSADEGISVVQAFIREQTGVDYDDPAAWRGLRRLLAAGKLSAGDALLVAQFASLDREFLAHPDKIGLRPRYLFAPSRISELLPRARAKLRGRAPAPPAEELPALESVPLLEPPAPELSTLVDPAEPWGRVQERWRVGSIGADQELGLRLRFVAYDPAANVVRLEAANAAHVDWWCMHGSLLFASLAKTEWPGATVEVRNRDRAVFDPRPAWRPR